MRRLLNFPETRHTQEASQRTRVYREAAERWMHATFVPTDRNGPSADLFARAGFSRTSPDRWTLSARDLPPRRPEWFTVDG